MGNLWLRCSQKVAAFVTLWALVLLISVMVTAPESALATGPRSGSSSRTVDRHRETSEKSIDCTAGPEPRESRSKAISPICPRLPKRLPPASLRAGQLQALDGKGGLGVVTQLVTNEAGDSIEVSDAQPAPPYLPSAGFDKNCSEVIPYLGSRYNPCGYVTFYDSKWKSTKAPKTNVEEDAEYDACGKLVSSGKTEGWHVTGKEYTESGWHAGHIEEIPPSEPVACLGTWTERYVFTETFSDKETLTESIEVPFHVVLEIPNNATWGGGNPSEQSCSQVCAGDPVNTATGDYFESTTDLAVRGRGPGLEMTRTYSSLAASAKVSSPLGRGWTFSYGMSLSANPQTGYVTVTNDNGSQTRFEPNSKGDFIAPPRVLATLVENESGTYTYVIKKRTTYTFDSAGMLTSIEDLNGEKTALSYEFGRLTEATDEDGRSFTFGYDPYGRLESVVDSTGREITYGYNELGYMDEVTDARGGHEHFTYNAAGFLLTREDARGDVVLTNTFNEFGQTLTQTNGLESTTKFKYLRSGSTTWRDVTDPRGFETEYEYVNNILAKKTEAVGTSEEATWTYERDPYTLGITAVTDPKGHTSHATYDLDGNQTSTEDALGNATESVYDSLDDLTEYIDAEGVTTIFEYDEAGNLLSSSTPLLSSEPPKSRTTSYLHEDEEHSGDITAITDPNGKTTHFAYDSAGDLESVTDAEGDKTTYEYDERGNRLAQVSPRGNVEGAKPAEYTTIYEYDKAGNRLSAIDPLGDERTWEYDADGNLEAETNAEGKTTSYTYDAANQLISIERPDGQTEETRYDADGNVEVQIDGLEHETIYSYDALDRLETKTDPRGRETEYRYDPAGNLERIKDAQERFTYFEYDESNELTEVAYGDEVTPSVEYEYDPNGRRVLMIDGTGESSYEYDSLGRLRATTDGHGDTTSYDYDLAGNLTGITYPNGKSITRVFDDAGRLESVSDWLGNTTSFAYDPDSDLQSTTFPEGTENIDEYGYDRAGRMTGVEMDEGAEPLASLEYLRDKLGQVESLTSEGLPGSESEAFEYDENNRLTKAGSEDFEYDAANNLTKALGIANTYDAANQFKSRAGTSYRYDRAGERIEAGPPTAGYISAFGSTGNGNGQFEHPAGIAIDSEGDVWVADEENDRVEEFDDEGEYLSQFGTEGEEEGQLQSPTDVAIDSEGNIWVTDSGNNRVDEFNQAGEYLSSIGFESGGEEEEPEEESLFSWPESLAIDSHDNIWVADTYHREVKEFDHNGELIGAFGGEFGSEPGQIIEASAIAVDSEDHVWLADYSNFRVTEFDDEGNFIREFGNVGSDDGQFEGPDAIDVDAEGNVWVADEWNPRVQKFNKEGEYLGQFGEAGSGEGQFSFSWRIGLATDSKGNIWVSDTQNARVQQWQMPESGGVAPTKYKYDGGGNLISVERAEAGESPVIEESYVYDGTGLQASQTVSGVLDHLTWDQSGGFPLLLDDGQTSYVYGPNGLPIEQISEEEPTYYHHDQLGSTRVLTDASGEVAGTFSYGAYGEPIGSTGSQTTPLGYAGQYTDAESGLQYLRARVYDPATGQFLTRDPLEALTRFPYAYAGNNPLNAIDPTGLWLGLPIPSPGEIIDALNPIKYYEEEIEAIENGCSYWDAVSHGLQGAAVLATDAAGIGALARGAASLVVGEGVGGEIAGYTEHGLQQVLTRDGVGVAEQAMQDAVGRPLEVIPQVGGKIKYVGENATVILNEDGEVVTAWANNRAGWRQQP
jgi:RHS repeat-associated protein